MTATFRCAIYARVSSDSGLEQDFNSLDAQRESAEAYIKSQAHEGWRLVRERFDDGGFSGGSIERPALQKLLDRIREQRIDIVVVYKVDRLTRSLADFAKLVELFDTHKVSFVSVTQSFNTTSSMGRLTLNVLLSFAQFEREVTGERIRDKIAASKRKGMWMGGVVPHGYRVEDRKLQIVDEEAAQVRLMFDLFLAHGTVRAVRRELAERGVRTRRRELATGCIKGGIFFTDGPIAHILRNRHYVGEINHKGSSWPGEHAPIVDADVFEQVQQKLLGQRRSRVADRAKSPALLIGKIFNDAGERMTPTYAVKNGVRYLYYISASALLAREQTKAAVNRVPAKAIETIVIDALVQTLGADGGNGTTVLHVGSGRTIDADRAPSAAPPPDVDEAPNAKQLLENVLDRVTVHRDHIEIVACSQGDPDAPRRAWSIPWTKPSQHRRREILQSERLPGAIRTMEGVEQMRLVRAIAVGRKWVDELITGAVPDIAAIAAREEKSERSIRLTLSLGFLDPALIKAAVEGRLPRGYGISRLTDLPPSFGDQWKVLGLARPT